MNCSLARRLQGLLPFMATLLTLCLTGGQAPTWAQNCPSATLTINTPTPGAQRLSGVLRIQITMSSPPSGWSWNYIGVNITSGLGETIETGQATQTGSSTAYYDFVSTLHNASTVVIKIWGNLRSGSQYCPKCFQPGLASKQGNLLG
jgi:hypothetical protein